jgi:hypothetical protein
MCVGEEGGCGREEVVVFIEAKNSWGSRSPSDLSAMEYGMFDSFFFLLVDLLLPISTIFFLSHHEIWTMMSAFVGLVQGVAREGSSEQQWGFVRIGVHVLFLCAIYTGTEVFFHLAAWPSTSPKFRAWTEI